MIIIMVIMIIKIIDKINFWYASKKPARRRSRVSIIWRIPRKIQSGRYSILHASRTLKKKTYNMHRLGLSIDLSTRSPQLSVKMSTFIHLLLYLSIALSICVIRQRETESRRLRCKARQAVRRLVFNSLPSSWCVSWINSF